MCLFFGVKIASVAFVTNKNIGVDTKIAGLRDIRAELFTHKAVKSGGKDGGGNKFCFNFTELKIQPLYSLPMKTRVDN